MRAHVDRPAELVHRVVQDRLAEVAVRLEREASCVARRQLAGAGAVGDRVCVRRDKKRWSVEGRRSRENSKQLTGRVVDMRDGLAPVPRRQRKVQASCCHDVSGRLERDGRNAKCYSEKGSERTSQRVARQPDLGLRIHERDVVVEVRPTSRAADISDLTVCRERRGDARDRIVHGLFDERLLDAGGLALVRARVAIADRRPGEVDPSATAPRMRKERVSQSARRVFLVKPFTHELVRVKRHQRSQP